jgi:diadenylate cyclase
MFEQLLDLVQGGIQPLPWLSTGLPARILSVADILLVAAITYATIRFLRRTRATNILWSLIAILLAVLVARLLGLNTVNAILTLFAALLVIALPILFHPELRRGLERVGRVLMLRRHDPLPFSETILRRLGDVVEALRAHG